MNDLNPLKQNDKESWLQHVWKSIEDGRENVCVDYDGREQEDDDVNTAMAWIREELGLPSEVGIEKESEPMNHAVDADGNQIVVGDMVEFRSDYEQCSFITMVPVCYKQTGECVEILPDNKILLQNMKGCVIPNADGFGGEYLRYAKKTIEDASRCWAV
jgi:hypothetical protein